MFLEREGVFSFLVEGLLIGSVLCVDSLLVVRGADSHSVLWSRLVVDLGCLSGGLECDST